MSRSTITATTATTALASPTARPTRHRGRPARLLSLLAVTVALFAAVASSSEDNEPNRVDEGSGDSATTEAGEAGGASGSSGDEGGGWGQPEVFAVGDLVELGDWQVKVHGLTDPVVSDDELFQPPAGQRWVAVDVEVTNKGGQAETVSSALCFEIMDGTNTTYMQTVTGVTNVAPPDGDVAPGASLRGTVEYEVPAGATGLKLNFSCDLLTPGTATIDLGG